jgi:hypothetical protein
VRLNDGMLALEEEEEEEEERGRLSGILEDDRCSG